MEVYTYIFGLPPVLAERAEKSRKSSSDRAAAESRYTAVTGRTDPAKNRKGRKNSVFYA